jgi:mannose-6-phosphate isomerase-like protein (cupin superfamily)
VKESEKQPLVRHRDETPPADWPFGTMQRIVTGGEGGIANVHVAMVTKGLPPFFHTGYDEIYYVVSGTGTITLDQAKHPVRPGTAVVIPAGVLHSLEPDPGQEIEFVIFGSPPMPIEDERARPRKA